MKKKNKFIIIVAAICVGVVGIMGTASATESVKSKGNFIVVNEQAEFYAEDVRYLKQEIESLFDEIN